MTLVGKVSSAIATAGVLGGGIAGSYYAFNNHENIKGRLEKEGFEPLNTSATSTDWTTVFTAYQQATKNTFIGIKDTTLDEPNLRSKCQEILNKKSDHKDYLLAKQWCVKEKRIADILDGLNLKLLNTADATDGTINDLEDWKTKVTEYESDKPKKGFTVTLNGDANTKAKAMRDACKALNNPELKTTSDGFNDKLEQVKDWCSIIKQKN